MKSIGQIDTPYGRADILVGRYPKGKAIVVQLVGTYGEPLTMFSTNLKCYGAQVAHDEFNARTWEENEAFVGLMLATGLFEDTGRAFPSGYVVSPIWRIKDPANVPQ